MAEDSDKAAQAPQEIDLDNIEVEILVICKSQNVLNQAGSFLTRRGWPTTVISDLTKAIEHLADHKPDFVLVSFSHPSPRIAMLPDLIAQTFNLTCLGFVEGADAQSNAKLNNSKLRYKISGQASGPSIHRTIRKILAERFNINSDDNKSSSSADREGREREGSSLVKVSGGGTAANGPGVIMQKSSANATRDKGAQMVKGQAHQDGDGYADYSSSSSESENIGQGSKGPRKSLKALAGPTSGESSGNHPLGKSVDIGQLTKSLLGEDAPSSGEATQEGLGHATTHSGITSAAAGAKGGGTSQGQSKAPLMEYDPIAGSAGKKAATMEAGRTAKKPVPMGESGPLEDSASSTAKAAVEEERAAKDPVFAAQSLMQKAVEAAMARYCKTPPGVEPLSLEEITYVGVFPFESNATPGYLVIVWQAPDLSAREAFLRECEAEIRAAFSSMNVPGKISPGFWTQLPAVDFVAWADNQAGFHFITAHQKREVGVAFFQLAGPLPKAKPAPGGMFALNVKDMSTDVAVSFKAYIYLKQNEKHFMYLRNGRKLQPEQKERLLNKQVNEVLMKSVDLENLRQYLAAGYLSGLIIEFHSAIASASQLTRKSS